MLNTSFVGRTFQLWEYNVSHGSLLIRSPKGPDVANNIDIVCSGVEYVGAPRFLRDLQILEPTIDELKLLGNALDKQLNPSSVRIFSSSGKRFFVVAAGFKLDENNNDIFDSPFEI